MITKMRGDRRVHPERVFCELLTLEECKAVKAGSRVKVLDKNGAVAEVTVTSVKTWKTRPEFVVKCKFGLYEFFSVEIGPDFPNMSFVKVIPQSEPSYW